MKEQKVYLVTYNACYENPENKIEYSRVEGCIKANDSHDANKKFLEWLEERNVVRESMGEVIEEEEEFDVKELAILNTK
tara:strand:- start:40 stop:276 length:237 start_codon:yes stop_codon:yes gene_type:complete